MVWTQTKGEVRKHVDEERHRQHQGDGGVVGEVAHKKKRKDKKEKIFFILIISSS